MRGKSFRLIYLFCILSGCIPLAFTGCDLFGADPPLEKPVPQPRFITFSRSPTIIRPGATSTISFSVDSLTSNKQYDWAILMANEGGGTVDPMTGHANDGQVVNVQFHSKNSTFAEVAVTASYPINAGTGKRSKTQCACITVAEDPKNASACACAILSEQ